MIRLCAICGKEFDAKTRGKYCSDRCKKDARRKQNAQRYRDENNIELITKICVNCGQVFGTYRETNVRCSECTSATRIHTKGEEQTKACVVCGMVFTTTRSRIICCSEECSKVRNKETQREWDIKNYEPAPPRTVGCKNCGKEFETSTTQEYCSDDCKEKYNKSVQRAKKKEEWQALPIKECEVCGKRFKSWQPSQVTCSKKCSNKYNKQRKRERGRLRKYDIEIIDHGITIDDLYKRDNGVCHLCNGLCDWDDYSRRDGAFIVGPSYPSIDHLIPRSKGGVHSWNNIKLAHHYCNTIKNNNEEVKDTSTEYQRIMAL